jgi:hypothetical protein
MRWGLVLSALATFAAIPAGYPMEHPQSLAWAGLTTYLKLTSAVAGISVGKGIAEAGSRR